MNAVDYFAWQVLFYPRNLDPDVLLRVILVQYEAGQLHYSEVKNQVPKNHRVIIEERLLCQHGIPFLRQCIDELFVQCYWWEQLHRKTLFAVDKSSLVL